jgi:hypothetical protein
MLFQEDHGEGFIAIPLPILPGTVDFKAYELLLQKIDQILIQSGLEDKLGAFVLESQTQNITPDEVIDVAHHRRYAAIALRCNIARFLSRESYRSFSVRLGDSILLRQFCGYNSPYAPKTTPSKSTLQRFENCFTTDQMKEVIEILLSSAADEKSKLNNKTDGLFMPIDSEIMLLDSTCMKLDIHFPTDWVLLRDCLKSIIQSIICIRKAGINYRMDDPNSFISNINKLSMKMTQVANTVDAKKQRKAILREMKKLLKRVTAHGERYLKLIKTDGQNHGLSEAQINQISNKLKHTIGLVPHVIEQAHERIIGGRQVDNKDKLLSIHEEHAQVYVRGKAGAKTEFGLQLLIGENLDGLITLWELVDGAPKKDTKHVDGIIEKIETLPKILKPSQLVGDRGFYSASSEKKINEADLVSNMCPLNPKELAARLGEESFAGLMKRRAQSEARIGIVKNKFLGGKLTSKGYEHQNLQVAWAVLTHNLWVLARMPYHDLLEDNVA